MQKMGGKSRTANQIAAYINNIRKPTQPYWEPFIGGGWILERIHTPPIYASDAHPQLMKLWQALQDGWTPPEFVTEKDYKWAKSGKAEDHYTAFVGFGCSYAGKYFGGYARNKKGGNYANAARQSLLKKINRMDYPTFFQADFLETYTPAFGCLIYCDPPYNGTTEYKGVKKFNTAQFWERCRWLEHNGHTVIISEYDAPADFGIVLEMPTKTDMHTKEGKAPRIEKLFRLGNHHAKFQGTLWDEY